MPEPVTNLINAGCYVFRRDVIDTIPVGRAVSVERETFPQLLASGATVMGYVDSAYWLDLGTPAAFVQGSCDLVRGIAPSPALPGPIGDALVLARRVRSRRRRSFVAAACVSAGAVVGEDAVVDGSVVFDDAVVEAGARVRASVIGRGARIGAGAVLDGVVIGDGADIGAGNELLTGVRVWPGLFSRLARCASRATHNSQVTLTAGQLPLSRRHRPVGPLDLNATLAPHRRGRYDPCHRVGSDGEHWRTWRTPLGAATVRLAADRAERSTPRHGDQAHRGRSTPCPPLLGADDDWTGLELPAGVLRDTRRRLSGHAAVSERPCL